MFALLGAVAFFLRGRRNRSGQIDQSVRPPSDSDGQEGDLKCSEVSSSCDGHVSEPAICEPTSEYVNVGCSSSDEASDVHTAPAEADDPTSDQTDEGHETSLSVRSQNSLDVSEASVHSKSANPSDIPDADSDFCKCSDEFMGVQYTLAEELSPVQTPQEKGTDIVEGFKVTSMLAKGRFGTIFGAYRVKDGYQVALKIVSIYRSRFLEIGGGPRPLTAKVRPKEVALYLLANRGRAVPEILRLLDWHMKPKHFIMVLERPIPCQTLHDFLLSKETVTEDTAKVIMRQAVVAAQKCCERGALHRNIEPRNILINPDTLVCKLFDFGYGDLLSNKSYKEYPGKMLYCPPEFLKNHKYHGEPATVWQLGVLLFCILQRNPSREDIYRVKEVSQKRKDLSKACCEFLRSCLKKKPKKRINLEDLDVHNWFMSHAEESTTTSQRRCRLRELFGRIRQNCF